MLLLLLLFCIASCDHCIKREFQHHREIPCPACQKLVKKSQLQDKTIEELNYAKETSMRKKVTKECVVMRIIHITHTALYDMMHSPLYNIAL